MYCMKCGQQLEDGSVFCTKCGSSVGSTPQQQAPPAAAPYYQGYAQGYSQPKKSRKGLIIGLSVGGGVLAILLVVLFVFILPGGSGAIVGTWYEQTGIGGSVEFKADGTANLDAMGFAISGKYTFSGGTGRISIDMMGVSQDINFVLEGNLLNIDGSYYTRDYVEQQDLSDMLGDYGLDSFSDFGGDLDSLDMSDFDFGN